MEKNKRKKIYFAIIFVFFTFIIAFFLWKLFFKKESILEIIKTPEKTSTDGLPISPDGDQIITGKEDPILIDPITGEIIKTPQRTEDETNIEINETAIGGITKTTTIVKSKSSDPILNRDGNSVQFYNKDDGKFYIVNEDGDTIPLTDRVFHNVSDVEWAPNKAKAIIEYPDKTKIIYDFSNNKQVTLPKHWEDFTFSSDSQKLVNKSLGIDPDNRWLIISNSDGSQSKILEEIGMNDKWVIPYWSPNNQSVGMYTKGVDANRREVFFIGQHGENFKSTIVEGWGFQPLWSENGDKLLYSVYSPKDNLKPKIWLVNASGDNIGTNRKNLQIETWAEKCTFASNTDVYCAVPRSLEDASGLFPELALKTFDDLYKINIETGQKTLIAVPENSYNISSIVVDKKQENLFFTDHNNQQIHKIKLKN